MKGTVALRNVFPAWWLEEQNAETIEANLVPALTSLLGLVQDYDFVLRNKAPAALAKRRPLLQRVRVSPQQAEAELTVEFEAFPMSNEHAEYVRKQALGIEVCARPGSHDVT